MLECTVRVEVGEAIEPHLKEGAVVCLAPGVHRGGLTIEASLTLRGEPGAVLDAGRRGAVLNIEVDDAKVTIETLTLRGGAGDGGGGLRLNGWSEITVNNCVLEDNEAMLAGGGVGGGILVARGTLLLNDSVLRENRARSGSDLMVTGAARATVRGGEMAGDVSVREGAELVMVGTRVKGALQAGGTTTRAPVVTLRGTRIDGGVENDANLPAAITVEDS